MKIRFSTFVPILATIAILAGCGSDPVDPAPETFEYILTPLQFQTSEPAYLNVLFQVTEPDGRGVSDLITADFIVTEDGDPVSPTESRMAIRKMDELTYTIQTVLLLDISPSVADQIETIKEAALSLVDQIAPQQEVAIYTFSSDLNLVQDFTDSKIDLREAVESISVPLGSFSTDLYGAIAEAVQKWDDSFSLDQPLNQGFLVAITDGSDEAGYHTLDYALDSRGDKWVYTIGLGGEIDEEILDEIGNRGFYGVTDISRLQDVFDTIQVDIVRYANSFYWLYYLSSRRDAGPHELRLTVQGNRNTGETARIQRTFYSGDFYDLPGGVLVNSSECNREGIFELPLLEGTRMQLDVVSHWGDAQPVFDWSVDVGDVVALQVIPTENAILLTATGQAGRTAVLTVTDTANLDLDPSFNREIDIEIVDAYTLDFESGLPTYVRNCGNWNVDSDYAEDGAFSLCSHGVSGGHAINRLYVDLAVPSGSEIRVEFDVLEPSDDGAGFVVIYGLYERIDDGAGNWLHRSYDVQVPAGTELLELRFQHDAGPDGMLCIDNINVGVPPQ